MLATIVIIATFTALSFYVLLYRAIPTRAMNFLLKNSTARFLLDLGLFAGTTAFMVALAGPSLMAMSIGATAGLLCSLMISCHAFLVVNDIRTPAEFVESIKAGANRVFTGEEINPRMHPVA